MVANYFSCNPDFCSAEFRNAKTSVSSRESYGDDAIGYVQLKRKANLCVIKCKICPEHKVRQQPYSVSMVIDEKEGIVQSVQCADCPASKGGCKHAVAFLMWTHRRSEEPSCTAVACYWKKSKLSKVGSTLKYMKIKEMASNNSSLFIQQDGSVFCEFLTESKKRKLQNCQILKHQLDYEDDIVQLLSLHNLSHKFNSENDCNQFINKIRLVFTEKNVSEAERITYLQHKSPAWYELRYARITASKAFDVTRCKTSDGSLIAILMGAKVPDTIAMKRGRKLEDLVKNILTEQLGKISQCGLFICQEYPMIAASPDGILNGDTVLEIKCPINEKTSKTYVSNNQVTAKYFAQVQLQMHLTGLKKCLFCVASWNFETNNEINVVPLDYNSEYVIDLLCKLEFFWKKNVYPLLYNSTK
ncbi:uncharacterized protein LOC123663880 [Melitaea cinxia]|uniref:uncharacterized protein LOC123663880 n=1 Tax=Melitaea cinxia TaxID=113334 RepID=UPI001E273149|nr:uncharacterized protein LOC123663880 [Melitaea cinxia]